MDSNEQQQIARSLDRSFNHSATVLWALYSCIFRHVSSGSERHRQSSHCSKVSNRGSCLDEGKLLKL